MGARIALDGTGGDDGPAPVVAAAIAVADEVEVVLVGDRAELLDRLDGAPIEVVDAPDVIDMADDPVDAVRTKRRSSLHTAAGLVASGRADAMVTPGNTGAAVLAASVCLRRAPGVIHPALGATLPAPDGGRTLLLDVGASRSCAPEWLGQFATLGVDYLRRAFGHDAPRVALLSTGHETGKGDDLRRDAHQLLGSFPGYVGQVEGHDLLGGIADVIVTDGFTGNVALKTFEGAAITTAGVILAAAGDVLTPDQLDSVVASAYASLRVQAGAVLLGLNGLCVICHGRAPAVDIAEAARLAARWALAERSAGR